MRLKNLSDMLPFSRILVILLLTAYEFDIISEIAIANIRTTISGKAYLSILYHIILEENIISPNSTADQIVIPVMPARTRFERFMIFGSSSIKAPFAYGVLCRRFKAVSKLCQHDAGLMSRVNRDLSGKQHPRGGRYMDQTHPRELRRRVIQIGDRDRLAHSSSLPPNRRPEASNQDHNLSGRPRESGTGAAGITHSCYTTRRDRTSPCCICLPTARN